MENFNKKPFLCRKITYICIINRSVCIQHPSYRRGLSNPPVAEGRQVIYLLMNREISKFSMDVSILSLLWESEWYSWCMFHFISSSWKNFGPQNSESSGLNPLRTQWLNLGSRVSYKCIHLPALWPTEIETSEMMEEDEVIIVSSLPPWDFCYF